MTGDLKTDWKRKGKSYELAILQPFPVIFLRLVVDMCSGEIDVSINYDSGKKSCDILEMYIKIKCNFKNILAPLC